METVNLYLENYDREKLFQKFDRTYVVELLGAANPQNTGRFQVPQKCVQLLELNFGDNVYAVQKDNSILLVKNPTKKDKKNVLFVLKYGTGEKKKRLRINQTFAKYLGYEKLGFSTVSYNKGLALRICPVSVVLTVS